MKVTVYGAGYVGLVTGVCLADLGNDVVCIDIDKNKILQLQQGHSPIFEPGLSELLQQNLASGRLRFSSQFEEGVQHGLFHFIAVGTPRDYVGAADLQAVFNVVEKLGEAMQTYGLIIIKSTVPVGTADQIDKILHQALAQRQKTFNFDIASNPEFLREGAAIRDFLNPDRIIVGADTARALDYLRELYKPLIDSGNRFVVMDTRSSELTKYASNAFLATKISFMNELSLLAEKLNADIEQVRTGMSMDPRIGEHFLFSGCGYGGSCFPKDIQALQHTAKAFGQKMQILSAVESVNQLQKQVLVNKLHVFFDGNLQDKTIALWGLAFKPNTDDMREAPSRVIIDSLLANGAKIQAFDPVAMPEAENVYSNCSNFNLGATHEAVLEGADVLVIVTEWDIFRSPNLQKIKEKLRFKAIFDGRNLYEPSKLAAIGLHYFSIGRGCELQSPNLTALEVASASG